jgi:PAS domain S-box-containing protein
VLFNAAAEKIFGWTRDQVLNQPLSMLLPNRFRHEHANHVRRFGDTGITNRRMGAQTVLLGLRASGEEFPLEASISQQVEGGKKIYTAILRDVTARVAAEQALKHSRQELRELASVSQSAREQEKSRVARELHDEIGGALTALKMDTAWLRDRIPEGNAGLTEKILGMQKIIDNTVAATRRMSSDLRPMMLDDLGLVPAIEWLTQDFQKRTGIQCELAIGTDDLALSDERATAVFRILQEALTNITKHANAKSAEVNLEIDGGDMVLTVHDDGKGFDAAGPRAPRSFGLVGMRERVYLLGGAIRIESVPGDGTIVEARIPIQAAETGS